MPCYQLTFIEILWILKKGNIRLGFKKKVKRKTTKDNNEYFKFISMSGLQKRKIKKYEITFKILTCNP